MNAHLGGVLIHPLMGQAIDARLDSNLKPLHDTLEKLASAQNILSAQQQELMRGLERVEQKLDREVEDLAENTREILTKLGSIDHKQDDIEKRVQGIEDHLELSKN